MKYIYIRNLNRILFSEEITEEITEEASEGGTLKSTQPLPVVDESSHESDSQHPIESDSEGIMMDPKPAHRGRKSIAKKV